MKRIAVVLALLLVATFAFAESRITYKTVSPVIGINGDSGPSGTIAYTFSSDTAVTLRAAYEAGGGTWGSPIGALVTVETSAVRVAFGTTPSVDNVGHVVASGSPIEPVSEATVAAMKVCPSATGTTPTIQITPWY